MGTDIEWADESANVLKVKGGGYHCTKCGPDCANCYAERTNLSKYYNIGNGQPYDDREVEFELDEEVFNKVLTWTRKPRIIFWQSMGDIFHRCVTDQQLQAIFGFINFPLYNTQHHTHVFLTKRPERVLTFDHPEVLGKSNIILGITAGTQETYIERFRHVAEIRYKVPNLKIMWSAEPLLEEIDPIYNGVIACKKCGGGPNITNATAASRCFRCGEMREYRRIVDWVICGCESGNKRRKTDIDWIVNLKNHCVEADIPFFLKQVEIGGRLAKMPLLDGRVWDQFPEVRHA